MRATTARKGAQPTPAPPGAALPPAVAAATVFVASGAVLVMEILAVRLLAPYVGLTLETTTAIIGAALAGIAVGAAFGGWLADRTDPRRLTAWLLIGGGLLALLTVPIVRALGPEVRGKGDVAVLGITLLALVPSAAVLSAISPAIARLQLHDLRSSGTIVGRLSAFATAGALVGSFGTGFVLVPLMPVSTAVYALGAVLVAAGLGLGFATRSLRAATAGAATVAAVAFLGLAATRASPCQTETAYHCAAVLIDPERPSGRELRLDNLSHSYVDLDDPGHLEYGYTRWIGDAVGGAWPRQEALDAVFVGGGGFTLPRWLLATRPGSSAEVMEVDERLVDVVRDEMGLETFERLRATTGDARMTMRERPADSADLVVGDAFSSYSVPWHLATREWGEEVRRVLRADGVYMLNVIDQRPLELMRAQAATLLRQFRDVVLVMPPGDDGRPGGGNGVLLASDRPLGDAAAGSAEVTAYGRPALTRWVGDAHELRDDFAPADQLLTADF